MRQRCWPPKGRRHNRVGDTAAKTFYADPNLITFHHYVAFLNEVAGRLDVSDPERSRNYFALASIATRKLVSV